MAFVSMSCFQVFMWPHAVDHFLLESLATDPTAWDFASWCQPINCDEQYHMLQQLTTKTRRLEIWLRVVVQQLHVQSRKSNPLRSYHYPWQRLSNCNNIMLEALRSQKPSRNNRSWEVHIANFIKCLGSFRSCWTLYLSLLHLFDRFYIYKYM